jgi:hypothetical protein
MYHLSFNFIINPTLFMNRLMVMVLQQVMWFFDLLGLFLAICVKVRNQPFRAILMLQLIVLPRQARDNDRKN